MLGLYIYILIRINVDCKIDKHLNQIIRLSLCIILSVKPSIQEQECLGDTFIIQLNLTDGSVC